MHEVGSVRVEAAETTQDIEIETIAETGAVDSTDFFKDTLEDSILRTEGSTLKTSLEESPKAEPTKEEKYQLTLDQLVGYYGDQKFDYKGHKGTITQVIDLCPAFPFIVARGFDAVVNALDKYRTEEITEDPEENDEGDDKDTLLSPTPDKKSVEDTSETKADKKQVPKSEVVKEVTLKTDVGEKKGVEPQSDDTTEHKAKVVAVEAKIPKARELNETKRKPEEPKKEPKLEETSELEIPAKPIIVETPASISTEEPARGIESTEPHESSVAVEIIKPIEEIVESTEAEAKIEALDSTVLERVIENQDDEVSESIELVEVHLEIPENTFASRTVEEKITSEVESEIEFENVVQEDKIIEYFEEWRELANIETALDELIVKITEKLDIQAIEDEEEILLQDTESLEEYQIEELKAELIEVGFNVEFDDELEEEAHTELYAMFVAVQSTKKTVEQLYSARTKEECREYVEQVIEELTVILRALGYDNPEKIIRDFLYTHSPESLNTLIKELEASLRRAMWSELRRRNMQHASHRHVRLGKFVGFIMQSLLPKKSVYSVY